jgi:hypothetical protein
MSFHKIWYSIVFLKSVEKIHVSLNSDKDKEYFTWRPMYVCDHISLRFSWNGKCFTQKFERKWEHKFYVPKPFSRKSCRFWDNVKNMLQPDRPQTTIQYWICALHAGCIRVQTYTQNMEYLLLFYRKNCARWHSSATLTEVFPCFFLSCKANARVQFAKTGHVSHPSKIVVLFYILFVLCRSVYCLCVNVYCTTATG